MKQIRIASTIVLFSAMTLFTPIANANNGGNDSNNLPVELKYVGNVKNHPLFELNFTGNVKENEFNINITDQNGVVLYSGVEKGEKFRKQFLLDTDDLGDAILKFEITGRKTGNTVSYRVSRKSVLMENMDVVKL